MLFFIISDNVIVMNESANWKINFDWRDDEQAAKIDIFPMQSKSHWHYGQMALRRACGLMPRWNLFRINLVVSSNVSAFTIDRCFDWCLCQVCVLCASEQTSFLFNVQFQIFKFLIYFAWKHFVCHFEYLVFLRSIISIYH